MSTIFVVFTHGSIFRVFFETAAAFGALSLYGYTTRRSLSAMGSFMAMGLFGLIIASVVNIFLQSSGLQWALSVLAILGVRGPHRLGHPVDQGDLFCQRRLGGVQKKAIFGALRLYLDFINMFQHLLFLFGDRRS